MNAKFVAAQISAVILAFSFDRLSKIWILQNLSTVIVKPFIPGFIQFHLTANTGAAFSLGEHNGGLMTFFACMVTSIMVGWTIWRHRLAPNAFLLEKIGAGLILGGALGNLYERFTVGRVTDFLQFTFFDFPIFNVADALIDAGVLLVCLDVLRNSKND